MITVYLGEKVGEKEPNKGNGKQILYEEKNTRTKQLLDIIETNEMVTSYLEAHYCNGPEFGKTGIERINFLKKHKKVPKINCDMDGLGIYATKEIRPGTELFLDYGEDYYKN